MGLLDGLFSSGSGGLLDFLQNNALNQQMVGPLPSDQAQYGTPMGAMARMQPQIMQPNQPSPLDSAQWPYGPVGAPNQVQAMLPPNAQPTQGQLPPQQAPMSQQALPPALGGGQSFGGFGDRLNAGAQNFANAGGLLPALVGGVSGILTGQRTDPMGLAQQNLKAQYDALVPVVGQQKAMLAVMNPEAGKILLGQALEKKQYGFQKMDDGSIVRTDPLTGAAGVAYEGAPKPSFGVVGETGGDKAYGFIEPTKKTVTPYQAPGSGVAGFVTGPDGKPIPIPPDANAKVFRDEISRANAKAAAGEKTEVQAKSEKFGNKMEYAERQINGLEDQGGSYKGRALESVPLGNIAQSADYQKYKQARDNFITALLRDESGAAIGTAEFARYERELFPQPGDSPEVVAQKRGARKIAIEAMKKSAGPGYKSPDFAAEDAAKADIDALLKKYGGK